MSNFLEAAWALIQSPLLLFLLVVAGMVGAVYLIVTHVIQFGPECDCGSITFDEQGHLVHYQDCASLQFND